MVYHLQETLTEQDWTILGHELGEPPRLPMRRLDMPIPYSQDGIKGLARRLAALSDELRRLAGEDSSPRLAIGDAMRLIDQHRRGFRDLKAEWETEYQELVTPKAPSLPLRSRLGESLVPSVNRLTGNSIDGGVT